MNQDAETEDTYLPFSVLKLSAGPSAFTFCSSAQT